MSTGPDCVLPTEEIRSWRADEPVKLRITKESPGDIEPLSLPTSVKRQCAEYGNHTALAVKRDGKWKEWTYKQYYDDIMATAKAFIKLGLEPYHSVAIFGFNAPEWHISDIGAIFAGGFACGLYPTNGPEVCEFIMNDARANILVVEDEKALDKLWKIKDNLPDLKKIVQYSGKVRDHPDVISWKELINIGKEESESELNERICNQAVNRCCVLIYTSGTTGNPKGVMLSHDNIRWTALLAIMFYEWQKGIEVIVSYLPLSHIAGQMIDIWAPLFCGATVYFADKMALKGTLVDTLTEVRPTQFFGVPRVWEKIMEGMQAKGKSVKGLKKKIADNCKKAGLEHHMNGKDGFMYNLGQKLVYKKVREALGLDRCKGFFTAAAPISVDTVKYFLSLDIVLVELFGMSETNGPHTSNSIRERRIGSVGKVMPSMKIRLKDKNENGEGEICMWGRNIMMGYLNREDKTKEDLDEEGWIHSGDVGSKDDDGFYYITGRIKELLITSGGENVAPVPIEDEIKRELPCISNVIVIGDKRKFLTCFLTFKVIMDPKTDTATKDLTSTTIEWCTNQGSRAKTIDDILHGPDPVIMRAIQNGIDRANSRSVSNASRVQRWTILPRDLSITSGELGPTLKLKRFMFNKMYAQAIENLYY